MILMRALLTNGVDQSVSSKAYHTELASEHTGPQTSDIANEIHDSVMIYLHNKSCDPQRVRQMLINFSLLATSDLLAPYSSPFTHH